MFNKNVSKVSIPELMDRKFLYSGILTIILLVIIVLTIVQLIIYQPMIGVTISAAILIFIVIYCSIGYLKVTKELNNRERK